LGQLCYCNDNDKGGENISKISKRLLQLIEDNDISYGELSKKKQKFQNLLYKDTQQAKPKKFQLQELK
jgi:hypothetical protein